MSSQPQEKTDPNNLCCLLCSELGLSIPWAQSRQGIREEITWGKLVKSWSCFTLAFCSCFIAQMWLLDGQQHPPKAWGLENAASWIHRKENKVQGVLEDRGNSDATPAWANQKDTNTSVQPLISCVMPQASLAYVCKQIGSPEQVWGSRPEDLV